MQPSEELAGLTITGELMGKWEVKERVSRLPTDTGGGQSASYWVTHESGIPGFMKAIDFTRAFQSADHTSAVKFLSDAYVFERDLCLRCNDKKLRRVVHAIDHGTAILDEVNPYRNLLKVSFLIFNRANADIRRYMTLSDRFDDAVALRTLHNIAAALSQFHRAGYAHQDLKPSNVLVFNKKNRNVSKLADLGRAWAKDMPSPFDGSPLAPGDPQYAPPEYKYGSIPVDEACRRYGCDLYLLGSMIAFMFTRTNINALVEKNLSPNYRSKWAGNDYKTVLPYLKAAFSLAMEDLGRSVPDYLRAELVSMVGQLCEPDFTKRGRAFGLQGGANQHNLDWFVSRLDYLTRAAQCQIMTGVNNVR